LGRQSVPVQHWQAPVAEQLPLPMVHGLHDERTQPASREPEELDADPLDEIENTQLPPVQTPAPAVQSAHAAPREPQAKSITPDWQVAVESQHPVGHVAALHCAPAPLLDDEELVAQVVESQGSVLASDTPDELLDAELPEADGAPLDAELPETDCSPLDVLEPPDPPPLLEEDVLDPTASPAAPHMQGPRPLPSALQTW
jgi:hypothetical protein